MEESILFSQIFFACIPKFIPPKRFAQSPYSLSHSCTESEERLIVPTFYRPVFRHREYYAEFKLSPSLRIVNLQEHNIPGAKIADYFSPKFHTPGDVPHRKSSVHISMRSLPRILKTFNSKFFWKTKFFLLIVVRHIEKFYFWEEERA